MKHFTTPLFVLFFLTSFTVSAQNCQPSTAQVNLDINNVSARILNGGDSFWDGSDGKYIVPKAEPGEIGVSAFFATGLWISGFDPGGNLSLAAQMYGSATGDTDYWTGYLDEEGTTNSTVCTDFDRFWITTSADIDLFLLDWQDGQLDEAIPSSVLEWPGRGNPSFFSINGFELPLTDQGLAPFVDINNDNIYDPSQGDYPDINGADQGIWWIMNDGGNLHTSSGGLPLQFEIQVLAYAYQSENQNINNATFYDYKIINRGLEQMDSTYIGIWSDPDLGCHTDDYVGCDTTLNLAYVYNQDEVDGDSGCDCFGINTYCEEVPMAGIKLLKGVEAEENGQLVDRGLSSFSYNNPIPGGGEVINTLQVQEYYNLLSGTWRDGTPFTYGGNGYNPSGEVVKHLFTDPPNDVNGWSMANENISAGDRRMLMSTGPFDIQPGEANSFSFAVIFAENVAHPKPAIDSLLAAAADVQTLYDNGTLTSISTLQPAVTEVHLFPNPMLEEATLSLIDDQKLIRSVNLYSATGSLLEVIPDVNNNRVQLKRKNRPPGIYYYHLLTNQGDTITGKFILH